MEFFCKGFFLNKYSDNYYLGILDTVDCVSIVILRHIIIETSMSAVRKVQFVNFLCFLEGVNVGAYCIRPLNCLQLLRKLGVCNTPLRNILFGPHSVGVGLTPTRLNCGQPQGLPLQYFNKYQSKML